MVREAVDDTAGAAKVSLKLVCMESNLIALSSLEAEDAWWNLHDVIKERGNHRACQVSCLRGQLGRL